MNPSLAVAIYASLCLVWGSTWMAIKISLDGIPPFLGASIRFILSAAILYAALWARKAKLRLTRDGQISVLSCGFLGFTVNYAGVYWAEMYIPSGLAAILFSTMPLLVALLSHYWTKGERLTLRKTAGILVGMAGTAVIFRPEVGISRSMLLGMAATLAASLSAAANLVILKKHSRGVDIYVLNALGMSIGALCLLGLSILLEPRATLVLSWPNVLATVYLSVFGTVLAFLAYYRLIHEMDASLLSMITLIFPGVALVLGRVLLNETISPSALAGAGIVLAGLAIAIVPSSLLRGARR